MGAGQTDDETLALTLRAQDTAPLAPPLGDTGRYRVLQLIGSGGMGVVFEALDRRLGTRVALKTLRGLDGPMLLRLKNEFRSLADLRHPNLVQLGELVHDSGRWFFTMELVRGRDLLAHVRPAGACDEGRLRAALAQLAAGLGALHAAQKVHRDVKPSNILVEPEGRVVLLDFGLVADADDGEMLDPQAGTPEYMAPEQLRGERAGPASDWYAVGMMLYEALAGRRPEGAAPVPPSRYDAAAPADLEALCLALLAPDAGARPTGAQVQARLGSAVSAKAPPPFIGRSAELATLHAALARAAAGPVVLLVEGESGVGKTALVRHFAGQTSRAGAVLLAGRCHEREAVPFKALDGVVDAVSRHVDRLPPADQDALAAMDAVADAFPVLRSVAAGAPERRRPLEAVERRRQLSAALRTLFHRLAGPGAPLVVTIDDLQWSDADSLALLDDLLRPPAAPPLLLVGTTRAGTPLPLTAPVTRIAIEGLTPVDARALCLAAGGEPARASALAEEARGHPLYILELAGQARPGPDLDDVLGARAAGLPGRPRELLDLLAVAGGPVAEEVLARATGQAAGVYAEGVALLRGERLARTAGASIETYHDRVRAAVLRGLPERERRACHQRLALGLEAVGQADPELLALHWQGAGELLRASDHAVRAGDRAAAALAFERAVRLYRLAMALHPERADAVQVRARLGDALSDLGRQIEAAQAYLDGARTATPALSVDLKRRAAQHLLASHDLQRALPLLDETLAAVGLRRPRGDVATTVALVLLRVRLALRGLRYRLRPDQEIPADLRARIDVCESAWIGLGMTNRNLEGALFETRYLLDCLDAGEPRRLALAFAAEVFLNAMLGPRSAGRLRTLVPTAVALAERCGDPLARARLVIMEGVLAWHAGRWSEAEERFIHGQELVRQECTGANLERQFTQYALFCLRVYTGRLNNVRPMMDEGAREAQARGDAWSTNLYRGTGYAAVMRLADGDVDGARSCVEESRGSALPFWVRSYAQLSVALYSDDAPEIAQGLQDLRGQWGRLRWSQVLNMPIDGLQLWDMRGRAALAVARLARGRARRALIAEARRAARAVARQPVPWAAPHARLLDAGLCASQGDRPRTEALLAQAAAGFTAVHLPMHAAIAALRRAELAGHSTVDDWFAGAGVVDPRRFSRIYAPPTA
jgi:hypothetical protein